MSLYAGEILYNPSKNKSSASLGTSLFKRERERVSEVLCLHFVDRVRYGVLTFVSEIPCYIN